MKIGDVVKSTKIRPSEPAKVIKADIKIRCNDKTMRNEVRTEYIAEFPDKTTFTFYGFDINRSVFKVQESDGQMRLEDFIEIHREEN